MENNKRLTRNSTGQAPSHKPAVCNRLGAGRVDVELESGIELKEQKEHYMFKTSES